jgi:mono/diheme cytochrome c family protein
MRLVAVVVLMACAAGAAPLGAQGKTAEVPKAKAVELYAANCQVCHGPSGTGTPLVAGSAFVGRKWKHGSRPQDVVTTITNGVPGTMMLPFKDRLSPGEIAALASLVRSYDKALKPAGAKK